MSDMSQHDLVCLMAASIKGGNVERSIDFAVYIAEQIVMRVEIGRDAWRRAGGREREWGDDCE